MSMKDYYPYPKHGPIKNYFPLPNEVFLLGLKPGELAVYSYLMRCENRKTHQCHPSYKMIGRAVRLTPNTVRKYVDSLCEKKLIVTEHTTITTREGEKRNGTLFYTIRPIQEAIDYNYAQKMNQLELDTARQEVPRRRAGHGRDLHQFLPLECPDKEFWPVRF